GDPGSAGFQRPWAIPLIACTGALVSAWLIARFAPEAEGHGTDDAIEAVHTDPRRIRGRAIVVKTVASALTIGSGGSGGREGPAAQISAGFGSLLTRRLDLSDDDGRIAVSLGIGAGIGAIFGAPLGGAVLAASIGYRKDFDYTVLVPGFIASAAAYAVFGSILGFDPLFGHVAADFRFDHAALLLWFVVLGVLSAGVGYLYARTFYGIRAVTADLPGGRIVKPALGGLAVGLLGLALPQVLSSGYGWAQKATVTDTLMALPLWLVLVVPFAKILATGLSIGTGGSGGIFGPGVVIGAFVGAALWRLGEAVDAPGLPESPGGFGVGGVRACFGSVARVPVAVLLMGGEAAGAVDAPGLPESPGVFVVVGMMACFGSVAHVPLAVLLMVAEMTGSFSVVPGAMVAVGLAYLLITRTDVSIYAAQRMDRESAAAERARRGAGGDS